MNARGSRITPREYELLKKLEQFRRDGVALTPAKFCEEMGLAGTSSIKRFSALKAALNLYGWQTSPDKMRGTRPTLLEPAPIGEDPRVERLQREVEALKEKLASLEGLKDEIKEKDRRIDRFRGVHMALLAHHVRSDARRAIDVERRLLELTREVAGADGVPENPPGSSGIEDVLREAARRSEADQDAQED